MNHRRSHSDPEVKSTLLDAPEDDDVLPHNVQDNDIDEVESVCSSTSTVRTVDIYTWFRLPDLNFSVKLPGWFVFLVTLLLFRGPPPLCVA